MEVNECSALGSEGNPFGLLAAVGVVCCGGVDHFFGLGIGRALNPERLSALKSLLQGHLGEA